MQLDIKYFNKRLSALEDEFQSWRAHFDDICTHIFPRRGRFIDKDSRPNDGKKRHQEIIDGTGGRALRILAAGMQSGLTSPSRPWYKLTVADDDLEAREPVRVWLDEVTKRMNKILQRSNFYTSCHNVYYELGAYGTGCMGIDSAFDTVIRCYPFTIGEYYLSTNYDQIADSFYRTYWATVRSMVEEFGYDVCSESVQNMYTNGNGDKWIQLVRAIEPNPDTITGMEDNRLKKYVSVTFEKKRSDRFLRISGYDMFPIMAPRWTVTAQDVYGISPGMEALGDVKMLHDMQKKSLRALEKLVDPPMNAPINLRTKGANLVPGGVNYIDIAQGQQSFTPAYQVNPDFQAIEYKIEKVQQAIREGFFADLFLMIANSPKDMTATEVVERHEEKLLMLGPVIERIQPELLDKVIDRVFSLMLDAGLIPEPPEDLQGMPLEVQYISLLAQAQKMVGVSAIEQVAAFCGNMAATKPDVLDKFDADEALEQYADMVGVPAKIIVSDEDVVKIREAREQQRQIEQNMDRGGRLAQGAKVMSETDMDGNNALNTLMGNLAEQQAPQPAENREPIPA